MYLALLLVVVARNVAACVVVKATLYAICLIVVCYQDSQT